MKAHLRLTERNTCCGRTLGPPYSTGFKFVKQLLQLGRAELQAEGGDVATESLGPVAANPALTVTVRPLANRRIQMRYPARLQVGGLESNGQILFLKGRVEFDIEQHVNSLQRSDCVVTT